MASAVEAIADARSLLEAGDEKRAARILDEAIHRTSDVQLLGQLHRLVVWGMEISPANRFVRTMRWNGVLKAAELRLADAEQRTSPSRVA